MSYKLYNFIVNNSISYCFYEIIILLLIIKIEIAKLIIIYIIYIKHFALLIS